MSGEQLNLDCVEKKYKFVISKEFDTNIEVTDRTVKVSDAFGLGIDESKKFVVFDNFNIGINDNDVVYITGDSGSGKSVLLKELKKLFGSKKIASLEDVKIKDDEILVENVGTDTKSALKILSFVGLNDAFLFLRKYKELSDGQKYRYRLAKLINDTSSEIWFADEFCATLDRITAKIVSYNFQRMSRKFGKILIVATTHRDLIDDLNPNVLVDNSFGEECNIKYIDEPKEERSSIHEEVEISRGTIEDYKKLADFHYRDSNVCFVKDIFKMTYKNKLIGIIVYTSAKPELHNRNVVFEKRYSKNFELINKEISSIARIVIHPKFRTLGLGHKIVRDTLPLSKAKVVEALSVMAKYNPILSKAGLSKYNDENYSVLNEFKQSIKLLEKYGFNVEMIGSIKYNKEILDKLSDEDFMHIKEKIKVGQRLDYGRGTAWTKRRQKEMRNILDVDREEFAVFLKRWKPYEVDYMYWINKDYKEDINTQQTL